MISSSAWQCEQRWCATFKTWLASQRHLWINVDLFNLMDKKHFVRSCPFAQSGKVWHGVKRWIKLKPFCFTTALCPAFITCINISFFIKTTTYKYNWTQRDMSVYIISKQPCTITNIMNTLNKISCLTLNFVEYIFYFATLQVKSRESTPTDRFQAS